MARIDFVTGAPERYSGLVDQIEQARSSLRVVVARETEANMRLHANSEDWSAKRTLAHLGVYLRLNSVFIRRIATMTDPERQAIDEEKAIEESSFMTGSAMDLMQSIDKSVDETIELLSGTPDASWGRRGSVEGVSRSLRQQVEGYSSHILEHTEQIKMALAQN